MSAATNQEAFSVDLVNGNVKAAMRIAGAKSADLWKVPRSHIRTMPGFNPRNPDDPDYIAHIRALADSMKANGYYDDKPIAGFVSLENDIEVINVTDGHSRLAAFDIAVTEGFEATTLPVVVSPRGTNLEDLTVALVKRNGGKPLTPFEIAIVCKRLIGYGMDEKEIGKRLGYTTQYVEDLLNLVAAPKPVRDLVTTGKVSATTARKALKEHGNKAGGVLAAAVAQAEASGKRRATDKHVRKAVGSQPAAALTSAVRDVLAERQRQIEAEGWSLPHDDAHAQGELAAAAGSYALHAFEGPALKSDFAPAWWPWSKNWWKPGPARRMLVKAGALILAEIERVDRAEQAGAKTPGVEA